MRAIINNSTLVKLHDKQMRQRFVSVPIKTLRHVSDMPEVTSSYINSFANDT